MTAFSNGILFQMVVQNGRRVNVLTAVYTSYAPGKCNVGVMKKEDPNMNEYFKIGGRVALASRDYPHLNYGQTFIVRRIDRYSAYAFSFSVMVQPEGSKKKFYIKPEHLHNNEMPYTSI
jgi:hypothetical protein